MDFVDALRARLQALDGLAEEEEFICKLKEIEDEASNSPHLQASPYNLRQFELLLKRPRERAKAMANKKRSFKLSSSLPQQQQGKPASIATVSTTTTSPPPSQAPLRLTSENGQAFENTDLLYANLTDEEICITIPLSALTLVGLVRCKVQVSATIASSLVVRNCVDCEVRVQSTSQTRIHSSRNTSFYLHCATDPIIEQCSALRFGHYHAENTARYLVKDFNWLLPNKPSPNWSWIEEE